ncbi:MAG: hypothetical protein ACKOTD_01460, partial [Phycisphaerales bacterium]
MSGPSGPDAGDGKVPSTQEEVVASALAAVRRHLGTLFGAAPGPGSFGGSAAPVHACCAASRTVR